jgi:hypothetical protein
VTCIVVQKGMLSLVSVRSSFRNGGGVNDPVSERRLCLKSIIVPSCVTFNFVY